MKSFALLLSLFVLSPAAERLATDYGTQEVRRIEVETRIELESATTVRGGDDSGRGAFPASRSSIELREVTLDRVVEHAEGRPDKVERRFEEVRGRASTTFGEREREAEFESPLAGLTLAIERGEDDAVDVAVKDGKAPAGDEALEGHRLELFLDALLPDAEVDVDATWELDDQALRRALRLDVQAGLYAPPAPEESAEGRPRRGGTIGGELRVLRGVEWKGKAKLVALEEIDGAASGRIELEIEGSGEVADPERTGGGRVYEPVLAISRASTVRVRLEGSLVFSIAAKRPASLELEGTVSIESTRERERDGVTMTIETKSEGTLAYEVRVGADG